MLYSFEKLYWWSIANLYYGLIEKSRTQIKNRDITFLIYTVRASALVLSRRTLVQDPTKIKMPLCDAYNEFGNLSATDPRDRIYALLSLSKDSNTLGIIPDYSISSQDLVCRFVRAHIAETHSLKMLEHGFLRNAPDKIQTSWTPNICCQEVKGFPLDSQIQSESPAYFAGPDISDISLENVLMFPNSRRLHVSSIILDTVRNVTNTT